MYRLEGPSPRRLTVREEHSDESPNLFMWKAGPPLNADVLRGEFVYEDALCVNSLVPLPHTNASEEVDFLGNK